MRSSSHHAAIIRLVCALVATGYGAGHARADADPDRVPDVFSYTQPAQENRVRALLELTGVYTVGFTFFLAINRLIPRYEIGYSWPVFRKKLLGEGLELDVNGLNTNFVGHPVGGSMYYTMARSNQLNIAESTAIAIGGSYLWEMFGEIREFVSINDMIVTPLAGVAIAEPLFQLGAFFDRSSPALRNRILGTLFAPVKALNDALDGRTLARASARDANGFPADEYHRFDLRMGVAAVSQDALAGGPNGSRTFEYRLSLGSFLARLPGYDGAGQHGLWFADGNVSSLQVDMGINAMGLSDLEVHTYVGLAGYYARRAHQTDRGVRGHGTVVVWTAGYQYEIHDYDRDRRWPHDRITTVQPLGILLEQRFAWDALRTLFHVHAGLDFGGLRPYALPAYVRRPDAVMLPEVIADNAYAFVRGAHVLAALSFGLEPLELTGSVRYSTYEGIDTELPMKDQLLAVQARASIALGHSPARLGLWFARRSRKGTFGPERAGRADTSAGLELGARY